MKANYLDRLQIQLSNVIEAILNLHLKHPVRVAIDGFCSSGKTTVSNVLSDDFNAISRPCITISTDDFQHPSEIRWKRGEYSAEGFYRDAIDSKALKKEVLESLGPGGSMKYRTSTYDIFKGEPRLSEVLRADQDSILLVDGLFLNDDQYQGAFDYSIFVECPYEICIQRALNRNQEKKSSLMELEKLYRERYVPGFELYVSEMRPSACASVVLVND